MAVRSRFAARVLGSAALLVFFTSAARAVEIRYEAALLSHYVWRGITLTDGPVFQPSVTLSHDNGLALEIRGNVDLDDDNDAAGEISELLLILDWERRLGKLEVGAGFVEFLFPNTPFPGTREIYLRLAYDALVSPRLELHYDFDEIEGFYARLALAHERELGAAWRGALEVAAGWADASFAIGGKAGPHDAGVELRLERRSGRVESRLSAGWTGSLDADVLPDQPAGLWAGLALAYRF